MFNSLSREQEFMITIQPLEYVQEYIYQGQLLKGNPDHEDEIHTKVKMYWSAYGRHHQILTGSLTLSLKRKEYNNCILPVLT